MVLAVRSPCSFCLYLSLQSSAGIFSLMPAHLWLDIALGKNNKRQNMCPNPDYLSYRLSPQLHLESVYISELFFLGIGGTREHNF